MPFRPSVPRRGKAAVLNLPDDDRSKPGDEDNAKAGQSPSACLLDVVVPERLPAAWLPDGDACLVSDGDTGLVFMLLGVPELSGFTRRSIMADEARVDVVPLGVTSPDVATDETAPDDSVENLLDVVRRTCRDPQCGAPPDPGFLPVASPGEGKLPGLMPSVVES